MSPMPKAGKVMEAPAVGGAKDDDSRPSNGPAVAAMTDKAYEKVAKKEAASETERASRFAQPPAAEPAAPPPPAPQAAAPAREEDNSVRGAIARTQEQRKQKVLDQLADQELGGLASGASSAAPVHSGGSSGLRADSMNRANDADEAPPPPPPAPSTPAVTGRIAGAPSGGDDGSASLLGPIKDQIRRGQCADADAALTKLERAFPATRGLADTRAEWQAACASQAPQLLERRQRALQSESPPMPAYHAKKSAASRPAPAKAAKPAASKADVLK
jgi:hypothetical protein